MTDVTLFEALDLAKEDVELNKKAYGGKVCNVESVVNALRGVLYGKTLSDFTPPKKEIGDIIKNECLSECPFVRLLKRIALE